MAKAGADADSAIEDIKKGSADSKTAKAVEETINKLPAKSKVKLSDKKAIQEARAEYDALTAEQKKYVSDAVLKKLTDAEAAIKALEKDTKAKKVKKVTVNVKTVSRKAIDKAVKKAGGSNKYVTTITLGSKVRKINKKAFAKYGKVKTLIIKSKKLKKASVKKCLTGSKVKTVQVKAGSKKTNRKLVKKYKKFFTKKNCGRKVRVK